MVNHKSTPLVAPNKPPHYKSHVEVTSITTSKDILFSHFFPFLRSIRIVNKLKLPHSRKTKKKKIKRSSSKFQISRLFVTFPPISISPQPRVLNRGTVGSNAGSVAFQVQQQQQQQLYPPRYLRRIRASISALPALNTHEQPCYLGMRFR